MTQRSPKNEKNEKDLEKFRVLHKYAFLISGSETFEDIAPHVFDALDAIFETDLKIFAKVHFGALKGFVRRDTDEMTGLWRGTGMPLDGPGIMARAVNTMKTCNVPDTRKDPDYVPDWVDESRGKHTLSEIAVPVIVHGKSVAVVNIEHRDENAYNETDQKLLEAIAEYVGVALGRILYEDRLKGLHLHASQLGSANSVGEIAEHTLDAMVNTLNFELCEFALVKEGDIKLVSHKGLDEALLLRSQARSGAEPSTISRLKSDMEFLSELDVPVIVGNEVSAILLAKSIQPEAYSEQDETLLRTLALHVGTAISRLNRADEIRQLAYRMNSLKPGGCYLSDSHERCLKAYAILSMQGVPGLCLVRDDPEKVVENYGINAEDIKLLSSRSFKGFEALQDLQSVSLALSKFLESGRGVVLFDGLEYLITRFGFDTVYSFVQVKRFDFLESEAVLLVPLDMETLDSRERALLSSEFNLLE